MDHYLEQYEKSMELRGFAKSTKETYLGHLKRFTQYSNKHPSACSYDDVRSFLHYAIKKRKLSCSHVNSSYAALKFYYETTLCREWNMKHIPRLKSRSFLPDILTQEEVSNILNCGFLFSRQTSRHLQECLCSLLEACFFNPFAQ